MRIATLAAVLIALAACSPKAEKTEAPAPEAAAPVNAGAKMKPGEWRTTAKIVEMTMGGVAAPPGALRSNVGTECVTSDDFDDFVNRRSMDERATGADCRFNDLKVAGGRFEGRSECTDPAMGGTRTMEMKGVYGETSVTMDMTMTGQSPRGAMSMKMNIVSERIGDCPG